MKIKPYVEKLEKSEEFKNFRIKYPKSYMVAGFFILDLETDASVHQIDFYVPEEKKFAAFTLDNEVTVQLLDAANEKVPEKLDLETNIDLDALEGILTDEMHNRGISENLKKIIAVIQNIDGKKIWNLNCVLSGMEILKSHIEDESKTILKLEKSSLMDIMKRMPKQAMGQGQPGSPQQMPAGQTPAKAPPKEAIKNEIEKLDKIEDEIEKEKARLKKELDKDYSKEPEEKKEPKEEPEEKPEEPSEEKEKPEDKPAE